MFSLKYLEHFMISSNQGYTKITKSCQYYLCTLNLILDFQIKCCTYTKMTFIFCVGVHTSFPVLSKTEAMPQIEKIIK